MTASQHATRFTFRERFIASDAWMGLWLVGVLVLAFYLLFASLQPTFSALGSPAFVLMTLVVLLITTLLGVIIAPLSAFFIFGGMIERQAGRNGGPFGVGDRVVPITGRFAGQTGTVTSIGQCQTLRIRLDGEQTEHGTYSHYHLKQVDTYDATESQSLGRLP